MVIAPYLIDTPKALEKHSLKISFIDIGFFSNILIKLLFIIWFLEELTDDFYEFTAEDYHRILAAKKEGNDDTTNYSTSKVKFYLPLMIHYFYALFHLRNIPIF